MKKRIFAFIRRDKTLAHILYTVGHPTSGLTCSASRLLSLFPKTIISSLIPLFLLINEPRLYVFIFSHNFQVNDSRVELNGCKWQGSKVLIEPASSRAQTRAIHLDFEGTGSESERGKGGTLT